MDRAAPKRQNFFNKDPSTPYDAMKLGSRDMVGEKMDMKLDGDTPNSIVPSSGYTTKYSSSNPLPEGHIGYANLPNQIYRRAVRRGFEFNIMAVGESGLGKSTFVNSLFLTDLYNAEHLGPSKRLKKTVYVEPMTIIMKENGVALKTMLIDTPGFGDAVDNTNCWQPVVDYIDTKFDDYLASESRVQRTPLGIVDQRVHVCLYFIAPTGHGLKPLDIEFMRRIQDKVNVVPVIAKADTMTPEECRDFKKTVTNDLLQHKIRIYEFPDVPEVGATSGNKEDAEKLRRMKERVPFAVVGSNALVEKAGGLKVRARVYPWGLVEVENMEHNDFLALRHLLLRIYMQDLKEVTSNVHYENYRYAKLSGIAQEGKFATKDGKDPMTQMEAEKREHETKMKKMEAEMEQVFDQKVKEKKQKLKESEQDLQRRAEQMSKQLEQQAAEIEEQRRIFEAQQSAWEEQNVDAERRRSSENVSGGGSDKGSADGVKEKSKTKKKNLLF